MEITDKVVKMLIDSLYKELLPGLIKDMKINVYENESGNPDVRINLLISDEVYTESMRSEERGGYLAIMDMEKDIPSLLKYLSVNDAKVNFYYDNEESHLKKWTQIK
ncbi:hypothetical protein N9H63_00625 [bacterium]|nr:hypothetical protein [bacterium]